MSSVVVDVNFGPVARFVHPKLSCRVDPYRWTCFALGPFSQASSHFFLCNVTVSHVSVSWWSAHLLLSLSSSLFGPPSPQFRLPLCVNRWLNKQICSFSKGIWITHNRSQIWSPRWGVKQREERGRQNYNDTESARRKKSARWFAWWQRAQEERLSLWSQSVLLQVLVLLPKNLKYYNFPALFLLQTPPSGPLTLPVSPPSIPGTTCLVALLSDKELTVANVGDSRGVLCDKNGNAVPLSHDHKPYQLKERKRIKKAGEKTDRRTFLHFLPCWFPQQLVQHSAPKAAKGLRYLRCICSHSWQ